MGFVVNEYHLFGLVVYLLLPAAGELTVCLCKAIDNVHQRRLVLVSSKVGVVAAYLLYQLHGRPVCEEPSVPHLFCILIEVWPCDELESR